MIETKKIAYAIADSVNALLNRMERARNCQVYVVKLDDCEIRWMKESDVMEALSNAK
jgi:hypothetical protein